MKKIVFILMALIFISAVLAQETINPYDNVGYWFPIMEKVSITHVADTYSWEIKNNNDFPVQIVGKFFPQDSGFCIATSTKTIRPGNNLSMTFPEKSHVAFDLSVEGKKIEDFWPE